MVKIKRRNTINSEAAKLALQEAKRNDSGYNIDVVNTALAEMFHGKCYICENKEITSYQIEHLIPHKGDLDLKYDWNNLFWSCGHCNNTKLGHFEPIVDCTKVDVDDLIAFRKSGYFGTDEKLEFIALSTGEEIENTVKLLEAVFSGTTPQKRIEAKLIRRKLRKELSEFKEYVREYQEAEGEEKEDLFCQIKKELKESSSFTAFKRWIIKDHIECFPELIDLCNA